MKPITDPRVESVFNAYPTKMKAKLLRLRQLILETAADIKEVGALEETLKWGQPSYLTTETGSGTTIRIDQIKSTPEHYGMFVHCQTSLLATYREMYPKDLAYDGNRCVRFSAEEDPSEEILRHCIALALTYHHRKKSA